MPNKRHVDQLSYWAPDTLSYAYGSERGLALEYLGETIVRHKV